MGAKLRGCKKSKGFFTHLEVRYGRKTPWLQKIQGIFYASWGYYSYTLRIFSLPGSR